MKRVLTASAAALALVAGTAALPTSANAYPVWVIPAIIGAGFAGFATGAVAATTPPPPPAWGYPAPAYAPPPPPPAYAPRTQCYVTQQWTWGGWQNVTVCN
jgi:hypothetical protein